MKTLQRVEERTNNVRHATGSIVHSWEARRHTTGRYQIMPTTATFIAK